jgi:hypothetical protein
MMGWTSDIKPIAVMPEISINTHLIMVQEDDERLKRRAEFLQQKTKRREAEAMTTEQIIAHAKEIFSTPASKEFFRKLDEERKKNKAIAVRIFKFCIFLNLCNALFLCK